MLRPVTAAVLALLAGAVLAQPSEPLQLQATPLLAEKLPDNAHPPTIVYGDRISGRSRTELHRTIAQTFALAGHAPGHVDGR